MTSEELFKKYSQEIKDKDFRLEALSYISRRKLWAFFVIIYTEEDRKKIEVDKKTFRKLAKILKRG